MKVQTKNDVIFQKLVITTIIFMVGFLYSIAPFSQSKAASVEVAIEQAPIELEDKEHLEQVLDAHNFDLDKIMEGNSAVPRVYFMNFPTDFKKVPNKREQFIQILLPIVLKENEKISNDREQILKLKAIEDKGGKLSEEQMEWLNATAQAYRMDEWTFDSLLRRVDIIPVSLALGQASIETGYGCSYAAIKKNSPFGITLCSGVKRYDDLLDSVHQYMRNLNYNNAYEKMRLTREQMRQNGQQIDGHVLIGDLYHYSVQRGTYISKVRSAIKHNGLRKLDNVELCAAVPISQNA